MDSAGSIDRQITRLTIPAIVSNITIPLLGLADTAISGHLGSEGYLAAIAVGSMMMNVVFWLFTFLRMGTTGLTARRYGSSEPDRCVGVLLQALAIALLIGVALIALSHPLRLGLLRLIAPDAEVSALASRYFTICIWEAPAMLAIMAVTGWFVGMQDTVLPMVLAVSVNVFNILLSVVLVFLFDMGFAGVAYGTLAANWFGVVLAAVLLILFMRRKGIRFRVARGELLDGLGSFFRVNTDLFFRSMCVMAVSLSVTAIGAGFGSRILAVNVVMMQFFTFFSYFMDGLAFAGEALTGRYAGASDAAMFRASVRGVLRWAALFALAFFAVYLLWSGDIVALITDNAAVVATAADYRLWIWLIPPVTVLAFVYDGFYIGLTSTRPMLVATIVGAAIFFAVALTGGSNDRLWLAFLLWLLARGLLLGAYFPRATSRWLTPKEKEANNP